MFTRSFNPAFLSSLLMVAVGLANLSCEQKEKEEDAANTQSQTGAGVGRSSGGSVNSVEQMPGFQSLLLDIPPSMTGGEQSQALRLLADPADDEDDGGGLQNMMMMPTMMLGVGDQMASMIGQIADHVFGKPECRLGGEEVGTEECEDFGGLVKGVISTTPQVIDLEQYNDEDDDEAPSFIKYYANAAGDYDYTFEFYWPGADGLYYQAVNFQISPLNEEQASGRVLFYSSLLADEEASEGPSTMEIVFDNSVEPKVMSMNGYAIQGTEAELPTKFGIDFAASSDGLIKASGVVYRKELAADQGPMAPFQTKEAMAYVFKIAADSENDLAVQAMAIPQEANFADEDLFGNYSLEDIMGGILVIMLRAEPSEDSGIDCSLAGAWIGMSVGNICATNGAVTDSEVLTAAQDFCAENASSEICGFINQLESMKNPIYMTQEGLVGTGEVDASLGDFTAAEAALAAMETPAAVEFIEKTEPTAPVGVEVVE